MRFAHPVTFGRQPLPSTRPPRHAGEPADDLDMGPQWAMLGVSSGVALGTYRHLHPELWQKNLQQAARLSEREALKDGIRLLQKEAPRVIRRLLRTVIK